MNKRSVGKIVDYLVLSFIASLTIILILIFNGNRPFQEFTIIGFSLLYILWGIVHHKREGTFYPQVGLEYALFALLGTVLVVGLL